MLQEKKKQELVFGPCRALQPDVTSKWQICISQIALKSISTVPVLAIHDVLSERTEMLFFREKVLTSAFRRHCVALWDNSQVAEAKARYEVSCPKRQIARVEA